MAQIKQSEIVETNPFVCYVILSVRGRTDAETSDECVIIPRTRRLE